jgi:hypothetical protein
MQVGEDEERGEHGGDPYGKEEQARLPGRGDQGGERQEIRKRPPGRPENAPDLRQDEGQAVPVDVEEAAVGS